LVTNIYEIVEKEDNDIVGEDNIQHDNLLSSTEQSSSSSFQNAFSFHPITTNTNIFNFNDNISTISNQQFFQPSLQSSIPSSTSSSSSSSIPVATAAEPSNQSRGRGSHLLKPSWM
jgi:hypothetical protein